MKSKRVGHGHMKWAVCSALLTAALSRPQRRAKLDAASLARLAFSRSARGHHDRRRSSARLHPSLAGLTGRQEFSCVCTAQSVAGSADGHARTGARPSRPRSSIARSRVAPSTEVVATVQLALNAVVLNVDAADLPALARDTAITRIVGVVQLRARSLGNRAVHRRRHRARRSAPRGEGVRVAVIDSGIDYTHAALGGPGTQAAYEAAWAPLPAAGAAGDSGRCREHAATWSSTIRAPPPTTAVPEREGHRRLRLRRRTLAEHGPARAGSGSDRRARCDDVRWSRHARRRHHRRQRSASRRARSSTRSRRAPRRPRRAAASR